MRIKKSDASLVARALGGYLQTAIYSPCDESRARRVRYRLLRRAGHSHGVAWQVAYLGSVQPDDPVRDASLPRSLKEWACGVAACFITLVVIVLLVDALFLLF